MSIQDITNQALDAVERGDVRSSASLYADDFRFTGPLPTPLDKNQYLDVMEKVRQGAPNFRFNRHDLHIDGQTVVVPVQITGTQTGTLRSLMPGMPDLPPTGKSFRLPPETIRVRFQGDRAVEVHVDEVPGGGILGMLEQLGVTIPVTGAHDKKTGDYDKNRK